MQKNLENSQLELLLRSSFVFKYIDEDVDYNIYDSNAISQARPTRVCTQFYFAQAQWTIKLSSAAYQILSVRKKKLHIKFAHAPCPSHVPTQFINQMAS